MVAVPKKDWVIRLELKRAAPSLQRASRVELRSFNSDARLKRSDALDVGAGRETILAEFLASRCNYCFMRITFVARIAADCFETK
jgi:hypothetical protein